MNLLSRFPAFASLLLSLASLSSCEDNFSGAPYTPPFDSLAGRNGNIFYSKANSDFFKADIFVYEPDGLNTSPNTGGQGFLFTEPSSEELVFTRVPDLISGPELFSMSLDGGEPVKIDLPIPQTHWLGLASVAISTDGKRIAYAFEDIVTGQSTLYCRIEQGGTVPFRTIEVARNFAIATTPSFSPDGMQLAYFTQEFDELNGTIIFGEDGFAVADVSGSLALPIPIVGSRSFVDGEESIDWSPDGTELLFSAGNDLYHRTSQGLLTIPNAKHGAFSPDGTKIVYTNVGSNYQLYVDDRRGSNTPVTFASDSVAYYPQWSPDGRSIVFSSLPMSDVEGLADIKIVEYSRPERLKTIGDRALRAFWTRK